MSTRAFLAIGMGLCHSTAVASAAIIQVDPNTLSTIDIEDFEGFAGGEPPGTNYDNIIEGIGISFAERFVGQMLSFNGDFDVITGTPDDPVSLQVGDPNDNLAIFVFAGSQVLVGIGPDGFPKGSALGEGAVSILFAIDHFELGLDIVGESGDGPATFDFFRRDGSLIDSLTFVVKGGRSLSGRTATPPTSPGWSSPTWTAAASATTTSGTTCRRPARSLSSRGPGLRGAAAAGRSGRWLLSCL